MAQYNYASPVGAALSSVGNSLMEHLMLREQMKRQAQLDALAQQQAEQRAAQETARLNFDRERAGVSAMNDAADQNFRNRQFARLEQQDAAEAAQQAAAASTNANRVGIRQMIGDRLNMGPVGADDARAISGMAYSAELPVPGIVDQALKPPAPRRTASLSPGAVLVDEDTGERVASGIPQREPQGPAPSAGEWVTTPEGEIVKRVPLPGDKPYSKTGGLATGQQRRILNFYNRMKDALGTVETIEPEIATQGLARQVQGQVLHSSLQTASQQSYRQAQRAFTEARLRKESGAAVPAHEYDNDARTYFVQPGDSPQVVEQKKAKRQALLESTGFEAGSAFEEFYGEPFQRSGGGGDERVTVIAPNGTRGTIPASQLQQALSQGYKQAP
jgi:hypothetical protein